jgi:hypothetical protein
MISGVCSEPIEITSSADHRLGSRGSLMASISTLPPSGDATVTS